jgi:hypothetical protein
LRIFLSFNSKDTNLAETIRAGLGKIEQGKSFFRPFPLGRGSGWPSWNSCSPRTETLRIQQPWKRATASGPIQPIEDYVAASPQNCVRCARQGRVRVHGVVDDFF